MEAKRVVVVLCEGAHDVAFVSRILRYCNSVAEIKEKFSQYPSPLRELFQQNIIRHAKEDLSLDMAKKFYLPDRVFESGDWMFLLFNTGGASKYSEVQIMIKELLLLFENSDTFQGENGYRIEILNFLFLYDADSHTPTEIAQRMQAHYELIDGVTWQLKPWTFAPNAVSAIQDNKAIFVWCDPNTLNGTLEDIIYPIYFLKSNELINMASEFVNQIADWNEGGLNKQQTIAKRAKKKKAIICSSGQRDKPGAPLSAIINDNVLADKATFSKDDNVNKFIEFLNVFLGADLSFD